MTGKECTCGVHWDAVYLKDYVLSNGRIAYSELCLCCDGEVWKFVPMKSDLEVDAGSKKYEGKTLGEVPKDYLIWVVNKSKASLTIKKAAERILKGKPWIVHNLDEQYPYEESYAYIMKNYGK